MQLTKLNIKEGEGVDDGLFRIVLLNLLSFNLNRFNPMFHQWHFSSN